MTADLKQNYDAETNNSVIEKNQFTKYLFNTLLKVLGVFVDKVFGLLTAFAACPLKVKLLRRDREFGVDMKRSVKLRQFFSLKVKEVIS